MPREGGDDLRGEPRPILSALVVGFLLTHALTEGLQSRPRSKTVGIGVDRELTVLTVTVGTRWNILGSIGDGRGI